jgi:hypothetical protein
LFLLLRTTTACVHDMPANAIPLACKCEPGVGFSSPISNQHHKYPPRSQTRAGGEFCFTNQRGTPEREDKGWGSRHEPQVCCNSFIFHSTNYFVLGTVLFTATNTMRGHGVMDKDRDEEDEGWGSRREPQVCFDFFFRDFFIYWRDFLFYLGSIYVLRAT